MDEAASTPERTVMYYTKILPAGKTTPNVIDTLRIDPVIQQKVTQTSTNNSDGSKTITTSYAYNGYQFGINVEVDSVQTHNAAKAIESAWGVNVNIASDGTLSLQ